MYTIQKCIWNCYFIRHPGKECGYQQPGCIFSLFMIAHPTLTLSDLSEYEVNPMTLI